MKKTTSKVKIGEDGRRWVFTPLRGSLAGKRLGISGQEWELEAVCIRWPHWR